MHCCIIFYYHKSLKHTLFNLLTVGHHWSANLKSNPITSTTMPCPILLHVFSKHILQLHFMETTVKAVKITFCVDCQFDSALNCMYYTCFGRKNLISILCSNLIQYTNSACCRVIRKVKSSSWRHNSCIDTSTVRQHCSSVSVNMLSVT